MTQHESSGPNPNALGPLLARHRPGWSLERDFYTQHAVYEREMEAVWRRGWLFACHTCEIAAPGDYITLQVDGDSVIVIRGSDGVVRAMHNVCRHRGTLICEEAAGHVGSLVCPYHQWVYARDGQLKGCRGMQDDLDTGSLNLHPVHLRACSGFVFICLADDPPDFDAAYALMAPIAEPQGLDDAKVAATVDYVVDANWKLVWENNRECYHCNQNHPQYIKANFDHYNADDTTDRVKREMDAAIERSEKKWKEDGLAVTHKQSGMTPFPDHENNIWYSANRTPLVDGYVSETMDGKQAAPLMGRYTDADVGTMRLRTMPNLWHHASCDHAVSTRLLPAGLDQTLVRVSWLVHKDAVEGTDYQLDKIMPFWQLTSEQDWELCTRAQRGVSSRAYTPGPLSTYKEYNVNAYLLWYLHQLKTA